MQMKEKANNTMNKNLIDYHTDELNRVIVTRE
jgi:hypothetical protein